MIELLKRNLAKFQPQKLYTKLVISYLLIVIMSVTMLYVAISEINVQSIQKQAIEHNQAMLTSVCDAYKLKCKNLKTAVVKLYMDSLTSSVKSDIWKILDRKVENSETMEYKACKTSAMAYLREESLSEDSDLLAASIVMLDDGDIITETSSPFYLDKLILNSIDSKNEYDKTERIHFVGPLEGGYDKLVILYYQLVDRNNHNNTIGYMAYCYAPEAIKDTYSAYAETQIGDVLIISEKGEVLFDSSYTYYGSLFPQMDILRKNRGTTVRLEDSIMNVIHQPAYGFYVVGIIDEGDFDAINRPVRTIMMISIIVFTFIAVIFSVVFSRNMSVRTGKMITAMEQVKRGNLSVRADIGGNDEIKALGDYFDETCVALENYINREYVAQMRQKEAQIYALQNQINPHFLYNALESVRMKAIMNNDEDVSQMIVCLADIFRNNIKSQMVIRLQQELENCKSFLEFYNIRYDYRVELVSDIEKRYLKCGVLRHMLQPILENAIVHGLDLSKENNEIEIAVKGEDDYLEITISDNGKGMKPDQLQTLQGALSGNVEPQRNIFETTNGNLGLVNVNERIKLVYGKEFGIRINSIQGEGTVVSVKIKQVSVEELINNVQGTVGR